MTNVNHHTNEIYSLPLITDPRVKSQKITYGERCGFRIRDRYDIYVLCLVRSPFAEFYTTVDRHEVTESIGKEIRA